MILRYLRPQTLIPEPTAEWVLDRFAWLIGSIGPRQFFDETRLILPTRRFFQAPQREDERHVETLFEEVKAHMGMADWPCRLVPRARLGAPALDEARTAVAGSFYKAAGEIEAVITYNPALARHRLALIGTLAHELAHYKLERLGEPNPGGEAEIEALTDLAVIVSGFGVIDLEGAHTVGWKGALDVDARCYALATFLRLKDVAPDGLSPFLANDLSRRLSRALVQLDRNAGALNYLKGMRPI